MIRLIIFYDVYCDMIPRERVFFFYPGQYLCVWFRVKGLLKFFDGVFSSFWYSSRGAACLLPLVGLPSMGTILPVSCVFVVLPERIVHGMFNTVVAKVGHGSWCPEGSVCYETGL